MSQNVSFVQSEAGSEYLSMHTITSILSDETILSATKATKRLTLQEFLSTFAHRRPSAQFPTIDAMNELRTGVFGYLKKQNELKVQTSETQIRELIKNIEAEF